MKVPFTLGEVGHFGLAVRDPKKSAKWFERALGLRKEFEFDSGVAVGNDSVTVALFKGNPSPETIDHMTSASNGNPTAAILPSSMIFVDNDRWRGVCTLYDQAIHEYTVEAWTDTFRSWQQEFAKKFEGGISDLRSEALEGAAIVKAAAGRARDPADSARLREFTEKIVTGANSQIFAITQSGELEVLMATYPDRADATQYEPIPQVVVDRPVALFGA